MYFISTRGGAIRASFSDVLLAGLAPDGGLYLPESWPRLSPSEIAAFQGAPYRDVAFAILSRFTAGSFSDADLKEAIAAAYAGFDAPEIAPLVEIGEGRFLLELFHGPTLAFKDVALQILGQLFSRALARRGGRATVLAATSGDTGSAAIAALGGAVVSLCDLIESFWDQVVNFCERIPLTLVHGDFRPKNVHVRSDPSGIALFPMDWELAGWGIPAADLAPSPTQPSHHQVDLHTYWSIVEECWPGLSFPMVQRLVGVGTLFRWLAAIDWGSMDLAFERPVKAIASLQIYQADLQETIQGFFT